MREDVGPVRLPVREARLVFVILALTTLNTPRPRTLYTSRYPTAKASFRSQSIVQKWPDPSRQHFGFDYVKSLPVGIVPRSELNPIDKILFATLKALLRRAGKRSICADSDRYPNFGPKKCATYQASGIVSYPTL